MKTRTVTPMSEMIEAFVEYERLGVALEALREKLVHQDDELPTEWFDANFHTCKLKDQLNCLKQLLRLYEHGKRQREQRAQEPEPPPPPPKKPPDLKVV